MSSAVDAPQQHNQPSRKGKKAWRKNVNITEVQQGLQSAREEAIQGCASYQTCPSIHTNCCSGIISELAADALFVQDASGSTAIQKAYNKIHKPLKSDEILAQRSAVPPLDSRKRKSSVGDGILPAKRRREGGISHRELERLRKLAYGGNMTHKDVVKADGNAAEDLWATEDLATNAVTESSKTGPSEDEFPFLERKKPVRAPSTLKHASTSLLANGKIIPAVPKPVEGKSYNPDFEAWEALIQQRGDEEVEKERRRLELARIDSQLAQRVAKSAEEARQAEQEADHSEWESEWEGFVSEKEEAEEQSAAWLNKKRPERKTKAERNRIEKRKEEERCKKHEEKLKARERQMQKVKELAQAAQERTTSKAGALTLRPEDSSEDEMDDEAVALRRRKFGKIALPEAPLELILADELQDSLRGLRPEGNLLRDRFRSMQLRGKIETRRPASQPKKALRKATEKWSYKDWKLKI